MKVVKNNTEGILCVFRGIFLKRWGKRSADLRKQKETRIDGPQPEARDFFTDQRKIPKEYFVYFEGFF